MIYSKHNIVSKIKDSDQFYIVNLLYGNADIIGADIAEKIKENILIQDQEMVEKGYVVEEQEEKKYFIQKYLKFLDERDDDEIQIFFVPWYSCNFSCSYCYQDEYNNLNEKLTDEIIDSFFGYINTKLPGRKKYITLFGGEPLLAGEHHKERIRYFLNSAKQNNLSTAIVTNGYNLTEYIELFDNHDIREIQVTLDGPGSIHNGRRSLAGGGETFDKIVSGIDAALREGYTINLRIVVDRENLGSLGEFAKFAEEKEWTKSPNFKTQLGRNYELHHCMTDSAKLFSRIELSEELYYLIKKEPHIEKLYKPAFSVSKYLFENGELPEPLFDSCPGTKTEWAFDYSGNIYACTATVGRKDIALGKYYPDVVLDKNQIGIWEERDVASIEECKNCNLQLACGGGCAAVAFNNKGALTKPDCRPVKELLELGIGYYFKEEL